MNAPDRIERRLPQLLDELAAARVPDYFDSMLEQTARTRQRPAWASLERWIPVDIASSVAPVRAVPWRPLAILAIVALLLAVMAAVFIGSQPTKLPPPFGLARNGSLLFADDSGVIHRYDPLTGTQTAIVSGPDRYSDPTSSRGGRQIAFVGGGTPSEVFVAGIDGSSVRALSGTYFGPDAIDWSPDDRQLALVSRVGGVPSVSIVEVDGSGARTLPLDLEVSVARYLADGRLALIGSGALYVVDADGTDLRMILPAPDFRGLGISPSPDGRSLIYTRWNEPDELGTIHTVDIESAQDRLLPVEGFAPGVMESNRSELSPDGTLILFDRFEQDGEHWAVVPAAGGKPVDIGPEFPDTTGGTFADASWSPDGAWVVAFYPTSANEGELWLLDPTDPARAQRLTLPVDRAPSWQRLAP